MTKLFVLSDCLSSNHSFWVRIGQYLEPLSKMIEILIVDSAEIIERLRREDIIIIYRHQEEWGDISKKLDAARNRGATIVSDIDDYLWHDGHNRGWGVERLKNYTRALRKCDVITCSTETLHDQLAVMFKKQKIKLIENTSPSITAERTVHDKELIRIGWTGAPWTRPDDLRIFSEIKEYIYSNQRKFRLVHIGHLEKFLEH